VYLDCRDAIGDSFASRFPTVYATCLSAGINPAKKPIPVAAAAHYHMGGIATDSEGRSSIQGLWCVGECASTGLHGANRLASNSLAEALVFGARAANDVRGATMRRKDRGNAPYALQLAVTAPPKPLRRTMSCFVGVEREEAELRSALSTIEKLERAAGGQPASLNVLAAAKLVTAAALERRESLGAHFRRDYPHRPANPQRQSLTLQDAEKIASACAQCVGRKREPRTA
jgi:L-aspartate oxidase